MQVTIGNVVERDTHVVKSITEFAIDPGERVLTGYRMLRSGSVICRADAFVEFHVRSAAAAALFHAFMGYDGDEERVVADVCAEKDRLGRRRFLQGEEEIAHVLLGSFAGSGRCAHGLRAAKGFEQRSEVIAGVA